MKEYVEYKFPMTSKSKLKSFAFCKYDFYDKKILKNKAPKKTKKSIGYFVFLIILVYFVMRFLSRAGLIIFIQTKNDSPKSRTSRTLVFR